MEGRALLIVIPALAFVSVALLTYAVMKVASDRRSGAWRLARLTKLVSRRGDASSLPEGTSEGPQSGEAPSASAKGTRGAAGGLVRSILTALGRAFEGKAYSSRIEQDLARADIPLRGSEFVVLNLMLTLSGLVYGFLLTKGIWLPLALGGAGGILPNAYLKWKQGGRLAKLNIQIADALVIMANSLRAGHSFLQAMDMVAREMSPPISDEFSATMKEMSLGAPTEGALTALADRVGSEDLELVVTAVLIQRQIGGNLSEVLDNIAETIRERVRLRAEIRTLTAQGRLSGVIIGILPVALGCLLFTINPGYISLLFTHPIGKVMVGMALLGEAVGALVIRRIIAIEV